MESLIEKYRNNRLSQEELDELRLMAERDDIDLEKLIDDDWEAYEPGELTVEDRVSQGKVFRAVSGHIVSRRAVRRWQWAAGVAAVVAVLLGVNSVLRGGSAGTETPRGGTMLVSTGQGDRANATLPDGTVVTLNGDSRLTYDYEVMTGRERRVAFEGEGYFDVESDAGHPFVIDAGGLTVRVTGTEFNLSVPQGSDEASLYLVGGHVDFKIDGGRKVEMTAGEMATMNLATGDVEVAPYDPNSNALAWMSRRLVFNNVPLHAVAGRLERTTGYSIKVPQEVADETFTGMLPLDDITQAAGILGHAFNTTVTVE